MRLRKQDLTRRVNGEITVKFNESGLTSYAGLELLTRYLLRTNLNGLIRRHLGKVSLKGDYGPVSMIRLVAGMLVAGVSSVNHISFRVASSANVTEKWQRFLLGNVRISLNFYF